MGNDNVSLDAIDERTKGHSKRIEVLEKKVEEIPDLKAMMKSVIETNKEQTETMKEINKNLTELSNGYKDIAFEQKQIGERVGKLEKSRIDWNEIFRATPGKVIPTVIAGIIVAVVLFYFGLSK